MFYGNFKGKEDHAFLADAIKRFRTIFSSVFASDNVILFGRNLRFLREDRFRGAVSRHARTKQEASLTLRLNTLTWAAEHCLHVEGDFVECGVWRGYCMSVVADYLDFAKVAKTMYLYDTFDGIPAEYDTEKHDASVFHETGLHEQVVGRFANYPNVRVRKGLVPHTLLEEAPEKIAFLHLDMNSSRSEIEALEVLFDRVTPGGIVIFDDYGWRGYHAQQIAEDRFMAERGYRIFELPSGQGMLLKRG